MSQLDKLKAYVETAKYYTLVEFIPALNKWTPQFGDKDRDTVKEEMDDYRDPETNNKVPKKNLKIITTNTSRKAEIDAALLALNQTLEVASGKNIETAAPAATSPSWAALQKNADFKAAMTKFGFTVKGEIRSGSSSLGIALALKNNKGATAKTALRKAAALERVLSTKIHKDLKVLESGVSKGGVFTPVFAVGYTINQTQMALNKALEGHIAAVMKVGTSAKKTNTKMKVEPNREVVNAFSEEQRKEVITLLTKFKSATWSEAFGKYMRDTASKIQTDRANAGKNIMRHLQAVKFGGRAAPFQIGKQSAKDIVGADLNREVEGLFKSAISAAKRTKVDGDNQNQLQSIAAYLKGAGDLIAALHAVAHNDKMGMRKALKSGTMTHVTSAVLNYLKKASA
ncbi:hypothetical protein EVB87_159 [Rhizobium phage RHph_N28_1]|nr:hypothetical protein EVB87_159 [Rhizobium phage RHph_N28_1]QIG74188.1 hypothetical protein EVC07_160 [Rhizobium phage RHph_N42]QXV73846.1 hypothetical protein [Rhizobium phage RHph_N46]